MPLRRSLSILVLLGAGTAACNGGGASAGAGEGRGGGPQQPKTVRLLTAGTVELPRTLSVTGSLAAQEVLELGFQVDGRLEKLAVDVGDTVTQGQQLAALDQRDFALQLERAQAALTAAKARLGLAPDANPAELDLEQTAPVREALAVLRDAELQRTRTEELVSQSLRAPAELDAAIAAVGVATSRLQRARDDVRTWLAEAGQREVDLELARKRAADSVLEAPWPGQVAQRHVTAGEYIATGSPVLTLLRSDPLRLRLLVPERDASQVRTGQDVQFTVDGDPANTLHRGTIVRLGASIDRENRTLLAEAAVANPDFALRPGAFCRARIVVAAATPVVAVPRTAVQSFAGVDRVFTVVDGKAADRIVELGRPAGASNGPGASGAPGDPGRAVELVEVVRGVAAGDVLIADPVGLVTGTPVAAGNGN